MDPRSDGSRAAQVSGDPRLDMVRRLFASGSYAEARQLLKDVLARCPREGRGLLYMAIAYQREKRYEAAREYFEKTLELGPTFADYHRVHHFYGWCLLRLGDLKGARKAFMKHLESEPEAAGSHFGLGRVDMEEGKLADAEVRFRKAIGLDAGQPQYQRRLADVHLRLADVYLQRHELDKARDELLRATELSPPLHQAYYKLYLLYTRQGNREAAAGALKECEKWKAR